MAPKLTKTSEPPVISDSPEASASEPTNSKPQPSYLQPTAASAGKANKASKSPITSTSEANKVSTQKSKPPSTSASKTTKTSTLASKPPVQSKLTDKDCEAFVRGLVKKGTQGPAVGIELRKIAPKTVDKERICEWIGGVTRRKLFGDPDYVPLITSPADFVTKVKTTDFHDYATVTDTLLPAMTDRSRPIIPLGIDAEMGCAYRVVPDTYGLRPQTWDIKKSEAREVLECNYLGVNTNVRPPGATISRRMVARRAGEKSEPSWRPLNLSERSTQTAETNVTGPGFVFHQIGYLQHCLILPYPTINEDELQASIEKVGADTMEAHELREKARADVKKQRNNDQKWWDSGYYLVGELSNAGLITNFWIVFNMFPVDENDGSEYERTDKHWGHLSHRSNDQFSCAKLQPFNAFGDADAKVSWVDRKQEPVELVRCVKGSRGEVLRVTVEEQKNVEEVTRN